jgi:hypothetical protein
MNRSELTALVEKTVAETPVFDIHTHLYDPAFGPLLLWGIDELLVYHYLVAEAFRYFDMPYEKFWSLGKSQQANLVWDALFIEHSPVSESCRGVLTTLQRLGLDARQRDLPALRKWFAAQKPDDYVTRCMKLAGVRHICTTNSPFDDAERPVWERGFEPDDRFVPALRVDPLFAEPNRQSPDEVRRFLADWTKRMQPLYVMVSFPPEFSYPGNSNAARLLDDAVLPHCAEFGLALAMMPGVRRQVNPALRLAGDGVGRANLEAYEALIASHPQNKFLMTVLARENQHQLCVMARKFRNLHVFGCWWFTNVPTLIDEITRMRMELLGLSFTPQHSDARVLDQIIYKWDHARAIIARVLADKYADLAATGWTPTAAEIQRDVRYLFGGAFEEFLNPELGSTASAKERNKKG